MKTAYELAMERLNKTAPSVKLSSAQKKEIAELESRYSAKIAERELSAKEQIAQAQSAGDFGKAEELQQQLVNDRKALQAELEEKKGRVRQQGSPK